jgi:hypothetical protein
MRKTHPFDADYPFVKARLHANTAAIPAIAMRTAHPERIWRES